MTTYREISNTEVAVDAPVAQQLAQAWTDNLKAVAQGDATAAGVRIKKLAIAADDVSAGLNRAAERSASASTSGTTWVVAMTHGAVIGGTYNFKVDITESNSTADNGLAALFLDGVQVGSVTNAENTTANGAVQQVTVTKTSLVETRIRMESGGSRTMTVRTRFGVSDVDCQARGIFFPIVGL